MNELITKTKFEKLAISNPDELIFGKAPNPVSCGNNLVIGGGVVYPEINFTLPTMLINNETWKDVRKQFEEIGNDIIKRASILKLPGLVMEFEQLPQITMNPGWGGEITELLQKILKKFHDQTGIPAGLRVTVVDLRDAERPPLLRSGKSWETTKEAFICAAQAGADILSIESIGSKEVHDQALLYGDLKGIVASLGSLAYRDVGWLWDNISAIANEYGIVSGGDTACGFANTAMQLAGQGMLPTLLSALVRAASAPRSLAAFEHGAVGPSKDCAYEGPIIKAITGFPISMEGKSACCAHFSPLGNVAAAAADLWSNESVQNIKLLSGRAPEAFLELLAYDCRLFNSASKDNPIQLRDWLVKSDVPLSVEALMLEPDTVIKIAEAIINNESGYERTVAAVKTAFTQIRESVEKGIIQIPESENIWLENLETEINSLYETEEEALKYLTDTYGNLFNLSAYGLDEK